ncbi:uncharacterized protein C4orf17 homolog [Trachemys scripta elegans]|uniref:uncharacterized protein C4orf17 homolog n=1 Tax=Trachemys scripta elegans TaxID=31138 RepID=UPI001552517E|nr:uncharacterized protein C4orf17 homolog [Trachemys scripta elegans]
MNINFKQQPEPEFNYKVITQRSLSDSPFGRASGTYFLSRHIPHSRTVCHIQGLNNAPVCVVRDAGSFSRPYQAASKILIPQREYDQQHGLTGQGMGTPSPSSTTLSLQAYPHVGKGPSRPSSQPGRGEMADFSKRSRDSLALPRKEDPLKKQPARPLTAVGHEIHPSSLTRPSSPARFMHYKPEVRENINYVPNYLDQEIKVLEKLRDILQTDSLAEIQEWLSRASIREKEFVSNLIRSEMTSRDLLNYRQNTPKESAVHDTMKPSHAPWTETREEVNKFRPSSKASEASKGMEQERERDGHLSTRGERLTIPISENLHRGRSSSQGTSHSPSLALRQKPHLRYSKLSTDQRHLTARE